MIETLATAATYARISDDKAGDEHGVGNQDDATAAFCDARGLKVASGHRYSDNDIGASAGQHRPGYAALMAAAARREFGAIVVFHTSRLWRNRIERAHAIEVLRAAGVSVLAVKGPSLDMSTAYGRGMAALLGEFDTMETEVKSERQRLANEARARSGKRPPSARRGFGYQDGGLVPEPAEADAIRWAADALLGGASVASVQREWRARGLLTAQTGRPFTRQSILTILRNPRIAGLACLPARDGERYGEIVGTGEWEPILPEETWRALDGLLGDPARRSPKGVRTLLGGLARCACGNPVTSATNYLGQHVYRCNPAIRGDRPGPHVQVKAGPVNEHVTAAVVALLSAPDLADLVTPPRHADTGALRAEAAAIRANLDEMAADRALGLVTRSQMLRATEKGNARLAEIAAELAGQAGAGALVPFTRGESAAGVWEGLDDSRRREVIRAVCEVTLHPAGRGARDYDLDSKVEIARRATA